MALVPFDDRDGWIWVDGKFVPWREANTHVLSHALHYGSSVFEGERMYNGRIFKLREHTERLFASAGMLDFQIPYSVAEIDQASNETCRKMGFEDCYVRPVAFRGPEVMGVSNHHRPARVAIAVWEWPSYFDPETKMKGIRLTWAKWRRPDPACAPVKAKAAGLYMICTLSKTAAEREGFQDAMMLDWRGYIAEATGANAFFVREGQIHTPSVDHILDGITRKTVLEIARQKGYEIVVRDIRPDELLTFDECFLTGTAAEVTPVSQIGEFTFKPGAVSLDLMESYGRLVRGQERMAA